MKVQPAVMAETKKIAFGTGVLTLLMIAVFLILRKFDYTVVLGALLGMSAAVGNFFLMALTVQKVTEGMPKLPPRDKSEDDPDEPEDEKTEPPLSDEAKQAGKKMQLSYTLRMLALAAVAALAIAAPIFHSWAALIPMLFPRIVISIMNLTQKNQKEA